MVQQTDISAFHVDYVDMKDVWQTCRDAATGQRAIHKGRERYLPRLSGQSDTEYTAYLKRALYFNATGRTVEGMVGLSFRKEPVVEVPEAMKPWLEDVTLSGLKAAALAKKVVDEVITVGRYGLLVDYPVAPQPLQGTRMTVEQARAMSLRPYITAYKAEDIRYWDMQRVGAVTKLVDLRLGETYVDDDGKEKLQIRQLVIEDGVYVQRLWREVVGSGWAVLQEYTPTMNGKALQDIPFYFCGPKELGADVPDPPIEDLAYINIAHYRNSADLENGLHISGLPTPYVTGVDATDNKQLNLGSNAAWIIPAAEAKVGFVQVGADGFGALEKGLERKENQMAAIGARMIAPEKKAAEAAETASIRRGGENSVLAELVGSVSAVLQSALSFMAQWGGISGNVTYEINKDFLPMPMGAAELREWVAAWQSSAISGRTFYEGLKSGELVPENLTYEDEQERKLEDGPPAGSTDNDADD